MLVLPCSEEKVSKKKVITTSFIPNQTEVSVLEDFDLRKFMGLPDISALENKKPESK